MVVHSSCRHKVFCGLSRLKHISLSDLSRKRKRDWPRASRKTGEPKNAQLQFFGINSSAPQPLQALWFLRITPVLYHQFGRSYPSFCRMTPRMLFLPRLEVFTVFWVMDSLEIQQIPHHPFQYPFLKCAMELVMFLTSKRVITHA